MYTAFNLKCKITMITRKFKYKKIIIQMGKGNKENKVDMVLLSMKTATKKCKLKTSKCYFQISTP